MKSEKGLQKRSTNVSCPTYQENDCLFSEETKKHAHDDGIDQDLKEEEAKMADMKQRQKKSKKKPQEEESNQDTDLYAIMGLSRFGGSKKNN